MKKILLTLSMVLFFVIPSTLLAQSGMREISVIAKQFEFLPSKIEVVRGQPVRIYITSLDVTHGFALDAFGINQKIEKGKLATIEFIPDKVGEFDIKCSIPCGSGHGKMKATLIVTDYQFITNQELKSWLEHKDFFLIDVHVPEQEHIKGTDAFIPYNEIRDHLDQLPEDKNSKIVVYCRTGAMSTTATKTLRELGYKNVYSLIGGSQNWEQENT